MISAFKEQIFIGWPDKAKDTEKMHRKNEMARPHEVPFQPWLVIGTVLFHLAGETNIAGG